MCGESIGLVQLAADWGLDMKGKIHVDSSAAIGIAHRRGNGKLRHVKVGPLWIQELVEEEEILMCKVPGAENIADILTKYVRASLLDKHAANMGIFFPSGRAESGHMLFRVGNGRSRIRGCTCEGGVSNLLCCLPCGLACILFSCHALGALTVCVCVCLKPFCKVIRFAPVSIVSTPR